MVADTTSHKVMAPNDAGELVELIGDDVAAVAFHLAEQLAGIERRVRNAAAILTALADVSRAEADPVSAQAYSEAAALVAALIPPAGTVSRELTTEALADVRAQAQRFGTY